VFSEGGDAIDQRARAMRVELRQDGPHPGRTFDGRARAGVNTRSPPREDPATGVGAKLRAGERLVGDGRFTAEVGGVNTQTKPPGTLVPCDVLDIAVDAARRAGAELLERYGRTATGVAANRRIMDRVSDADRAAEAAIAALLARRRPDDGLLREEGMANRDGTTGLRWAVDPLDGTANYLAGIPLWCVSIACEDDAGTLAGVVLDPLRDELFAAVRGGPVRIDGTVRRGKEPDSIRAAVVTGAIACATEAEAKRAGKLDKRLFRRARQRRALGSAALELAWTAAGRIDVCFHEQWIDPWNVDAGLYLCRRAGLRVHRLPPLEDGLAPRFLAAPEGIAAELLELVGPPAKERGQTGQRAPLGAGAVAEAIRWRRTRTGPPGAT
jgi:myo-inositol-1(or 4)-monophosphatase